MNESDYTKKVVGILRKELDCYVIKFGGSAYQQPGIPDSLIIKDGLHIFVEFKGPGTQLRPLQVNVIRDMKKHGAKVFVVRFVHSKLFLIDELYKIQFTKFSEGVKLLLDTLKELSVIRSQCVPENLKATTY